MSRRKRGGRMNRRLKKLIRRWKMLGFMLPLYKNKNRLGSGLYGILYIVKYCIIGGKAPFDSGRIRK